MGIMLIMGNEYCLSIAILLLGPMSMNHLNFSLFKGKNTSIRMTMSMSMKTNTSRYSEEKKESSKKGLR